MQGANRSVDPYTSEIYVDSLRSDRRLVSLSNIFLNLAGRRESKKAEGKIKETPEIESARSTISLRCSD